MTLFTFLKKNIKNYKEKKFQKEWDLFQKKIPNHNKLLYTHPKQINNLSAEDQNLILITSVIKCGTNPFDYSKIRTVYNTDQRFKQTIKTISSLKKISKNKKIFLVECSNFTPKEEEELRSKVDYFLNTYSISNVRKIINGTEKSKGEAILTYLAIKSIDLNQFDSIYKISGRYRLNNNFNEAAFFNNKKTIFQPSPEGKSLRTIFYKINKQHYDQYLKTLKIIVLKGKMFELIFFQNFADLFSPIKTLGVVGNIAVDGTQIDI